MTITATYRVDKALYDGADHRISLDTTEYTYKNEMLVHQRIGKNLGIRLNNRIQYAFQIDGALENDLYFFKKTYYAGNAKPITRSTFEEKKQRFDMSQTAVEREVLEEYTYKDKNGQPREVQIIITAKSDAMTAVIDFEGTERYGSFSPPTWLVPLSE